MAESARENKKSWRRHKITGAVIVAYGIIVGIILYYQDTEMFFRVRYAIASAVIFIIVIANRVDVGQSRECDTECRR